MYKPTMDPKTMADLFLSPLIQVIYDELASPILQKLRNLHNLEKNIRKLQHSLPMVEVLLKDAAERQVTDKKVEVWLSDLKDKAYACYDLLDELTTEVILCVSRRSFIYQDLFEAAHLRTLLFLSPGGNFEELPFLPYKFIYLRVLDLSGCGIKRVQNSINVLTYLRYLDLSNNPIQTLPNTICDLQNLQTLNLPGCNNLVGLPLEMGKVISLRHLHTTGCEALIRMPARIGNLVHLPTLPIYIVGEGTRESILELNRLNLRGELNIKCLENVRDAKESEKANLRGKGDLHMLGLLWGNNEDHNLKPVKGTTSHAGPSHQNNSDTGFEEVEHVLKCLEPHPNLKKFSIKGYAGINFPHWLHYLDEEAMETTTTPHEKAQVLCIASIKWNGQHMPVMPKYLDPSNGRMRTGHKDDADNNPDAVNKSQSTRKLGVDAEAEGGVQGTADSLHSYEQVQ
ncbi:hypothetical protein F0562_028809 [Nyssa sinensis]|uniref:Uncharacterized protein n=1 Tax=Nyssa sinensis TaxID=561372 RepID=A0A5J5B5B3_9ASTE|nr:hypothetical protein F0562_028809 [Nyssa sinensis]